jgi:hypothetical protein
MKPVRQYDSESPTLAARLDFYTCLLWNVRITGGCTGGRTSRVNTDRIFLNRRHQYYPGGDPNQLGPVIQSGPTAEAGLRKS